MIVGINGEIFNRPTTGIGKYVGKLLEKLEENFPEIWFVVFCRTTPKFLPLKKNFSIMEEKNPILKKFHSTAWFNFFSYKIINSSNIDIFWPGIPILPLFLKKDIRKVLTVYDLNLYIVPKTMKRSTWLNYRFFFKRSVLLADSIFTISKGTAKKLEKILKVNSDLIVYPGVDREIFYPRLKKEVEEYLKKAGINSNYLLSVATLEPRKNTKLLIESFVELKRKGHLHKTSLVLVGPYGWKSREVIELIKKNNKVIKHLGYVKEEELPFLYSGAEAFIFPSIYEGFGMPVQEARACGCCVITSDIPELREAGGKGSIYIKPTKDNIKKVLIEISKGEIKCRRDLLTDDLFSWEEEAEKLGKYFKKIVER